MKACHRIVNRVLPPVAFLLLFTASATVAAPQADGEDTYEITLIKNAGPVDADRGEREILEVEGRRVLVEHHKVREGEWVWKIIRENAPPEQASLHELVAVLKRLNPHLADLDRIHAGEVIMVPLRLAPAGVEAHRGAPEERIAPGELEDIELERYTVRPGDSLTKILQNKYELSQDEPYRRYLRAIQRLNPSIQDPDLIHPGQVIRLPIHSPDLVRMPIETADPRPSPEEAKVEVDFSPPPPDAVEIRPEAVEPDPLRDELRSIFVLLGTDWIQRGQHYIPLKGRSGVNLRADNYPMIDLDNGIKVIVDLHHSMPGEMASLIETTWEHYRVVHLDEDQGLHGALDKILPECDLGVLYRRGEPYHVKGGLPVRITADWIIEKGGAGSGSEAQVVMITLLADETPATPPVVRTYLEKRGVHVLDYPPGRVEEAIPDSPMPVLESGTGFKGLLESLAERLGAYLREGVEIPAYDEEERDFNLYVRVDYMLEKGGRRLVVDTSGLGKDMASMLEKKGIECLSITDEGEASAAAARVLSRLGVEFDTGPLDFFVAGRDASRQVRIRVPGVAFEDRTGQRILATDLKLPHEIISLLAGEGYRILRFPSL